MDRAESQATFVLLHSPLTCFEVWLPVASCLREVGWRVQVPVADDEAQESNIPFWQRYVESATRDIGSGNDPRWIVAGHSGAGPLLPSIAERIGGSILLIYVDAGLPHPGRSRIDDIAAAIPALAHRLNRHFEDGGLFPDWTHEDLIEVIPDSRMRRGLISHLRPRGRDFFTEVMPEQSDWERWPSAYLRLSDGYEGAAAAAEAKGWPTVRLQAGHFHMLVDPAAVAGSLIGLANSFHLPGPEGAPAG